MADLQTPGVYISEPEGSSITVVPVATAVPALGRGLRMPYEIIWEEKTVHIVFNGDFTDDELMRGNLELSGHPNFNAMEYGIFDLLNVENFPVTSQGIQRTAELDAITYVSNPNLKLAIVSNKLVVKGITNMYKVNFAIAGNDNSWETQFFESLEDARKWLKT